MSLFESGFNLFKSELEENTNKVLKQYKIKLRNATDRQVLAKLDDTSGVAYEATLEEAKRRGLL